MKLIKLVTSTNIFPLMSKTPISTPDIVTPIMSFKVTSLVFGFSGVNVLLSESGAFCNLPKVKTDNASKSKKLLIESKI